MQSTHKAGFTMLEIICVLLIIGVLTASATGVIRKIRFAGASGDAEQLRMDLRHAQQLALGSTEDVEVAVFKSSDTYELYTPNRFANGAQQVVLASNIKTDADIIFTKQTGLPKSDHTIEVGPNYFVRVHRLTGLIE